jgi:hypothetical protein
MLKKFKMNLILTVVLLLGSALYSCSGSSTKTTGETPWTSLTYNFQTGSVAPKYFYHYTVNLEQNGSGTFTYYLTYGNENPLNYTFTADKSAIKRITDALTLNSAFEKDIPAVKDSERTVGGSLDNIRVTYTNPDPNKDQPPRVWETPDQPEKDYVKNLDVLYKAVQDAVPQSMWSEVKAKKEEFQNNHKD